MPIHDKPHQFFTIYNIASYSPVVILNIWVTVFYFHYAHNEEAREPTEPPLTKAVRYNKCYNSLSVHKSLCGPCVRLTPSLMFEPHSG